MADRSTTSIVQLLSTASESPDASAGIRDAIAVIADELRSSADSAACFLSVIVRTQGRRIEELKDALLCLYAQTVQDFEVILVRHRVDPVDAATIDRIVADQPADFRDRIRVIDVDGDRRADPLNAGIDVANGAYIAVYDDDDLLFANWVEGFRDAAGRTRGRMIRSIAATQRVAPELWPTDEEGFRASTWPTAEYAAVFDQVDHTRVNHSPFMTWAFPRWLFSRFGLRFDPELPVCEDWDMIQRASMLAGVTEVGELTAIYRRWIGGSSSYAIHAAEVWRDAEERVVARLDDSAVIMPPGTVRRVRGLLAEVDRLTGELGALRARRSVRAISRLQWMLPAVNAVAAVSRPVRSRLRRPKGT